MATDPPPEPRHGQPDETLTDLETVQAAARDEAVATDQRAELSTRAVTELVRRQAGKFALVGMLCSIAASLVAVLIAVNTAADVSSQAAQNAQTRAAVTSLDDANRALAARGQAPVATPTSGDPAEITGAAIKARVIAALPVSPSADQVAGLLAPALAGNVLAPSPQAISRELAAYYSANPAPPGTPGAPGSPGVAGPPGEAGRAPTPEEIEAAVLAQSAALTGPQGVAGPPGPGGPAGPAGESVVGPAGSDGSPGKPPASFSFTDASGTRQSCVRNADSPDDAATYECAGETS